jgi:OMF family outer membrane factor
MVLVNIGKQKLFLLLFLLGFQEAKSQVWTLQQCIDTANVYNKNLQVSEK